MDNRVLERIVIAMLLLTNIVLAVIVLRDRAEARRSRAEVTEYVTQVLLDNGITAAADAVAVQDAPKRVTLTRSDRRESEIARNLLGRAEAQEQGGKIIFYRTEKGQAVFRGSGEMTALFTSGAVPLRSDAAKAALRLTRRLGIDAVLAGSVAEGALSVALCCRWNRYPVYNAVLQFDYSDDSLYMISGSRVFDSLTGEDGEGLMDSVSALLRFVELVRQNGIICSRLNAVRPGYLQTAVVSGESMLRPVWRIETDTGMFLVNAENGLLETGTA